MAGDYSSSWREAWDLTSAGGSSTVTGAINSTTMNLGGTYSNNASNPSIGASAVAAIAGRHYSRMRQG
jgi:hypothetical protein